MLMDMKGRMLLHTVKPFSFQYGLSFKSKGVLGIKTTSILKKKNTNRRCVVVWHHDKSIFYANDCQKVCWVHKSETVVPQEKGEGASLMAANFVSADYG